MKQIFLFLFCLLTLSVFAANPVDKAKEAKAKEWFRNQPLEFIENKGQSANTDGKPADEVLFKTSFGNCDIYITNKGLSIVLVKMEEDASSKSEAIRNKCETINPKFGERKEAEKKMIPYYCLDMNLEGVNICKRNIIKENERSQGYFYYFNTHCLQGINDVKTYGEISFKNIYKGIDWVIYTDACSRKHFLKYDFVKLLQADYKDNLK